MRDVAPTWLVAALIVGAIWGTMPHTALACSGELDPLRDNDLIITGRVVDMELASDPHDPNAFAAVWVVFEVDRYVLGDGPRVLRALDLPSVAFMHGQTPAEREALVNPTYMGAAGACGSLDEDPRGQYWLTGASVQSDTPITSDAVPVLNRIALWSTGGIGTGPEDPDILERLERIETLLAEAGVAPAAVGHGVPENRSSTVPVLSGLVAAIALVFGARYVTRVASRSRWR
jgi:hypothetical protein